jgi:hypothetical protein
MSISPYNILPNPTKINKINPSIIYYLSKQWHEQKP